MSQKGVNYLLTKCENSTKQHRNNNHRSECHDCLKNTD